MPKLDNDKFLTELTLLFQKAANSSSVAITMKKYDGRTKPFTKAEKAARAAGSSGASGDHDTKEYFCLIRATLGRKKISTVVAHKDVTRFQMAYTTLLRGNMINLKKKVRSTKSDRKSKQQTD